MTPLGIRTVRANLRALIDCVARGEAITVTYRGTALAEIVPVGTMTARALDQYRLLRGIMDDQAPIMEAIGHEMDQLWWAMDDQGRATANREAATPAPPATPSTAP